MNFTEDTIKIIVRALIDKSKFCQNQPKPPGVKRYSMTFNLYDSNNALIGSFPAYPIRDLTREMYRVGSGSVESNCNPHPI